jgi:hypothetical protein
MCNKEASSDLRRDEKKALGLRRRYRRLGRFVRETALLLESLPLDYFWINMEPWNQ